MSLYIIINYHLKCTESLANKTAYGTSFWFWYSNTLLLEEGRYGSQSVKFFCITGINVIRILSTQFKVFRYNLAKWV